MSLGSFLCDEDFVESCYYALYSYVKLINMISTLKVMRHLIMITFLFIFLKKPFFTKNIK